MDPLTAAIQLVSNVVDAWLAIYQAASPETKQQIADQFFKDLEAWRVFFDKLIPKD